MNENRASCSKCSGRMEEGFFVDFTDTGVWPHMWIKGAEAPEVWGHENRNTVGFYASTYRYADCGFTESYATHKAPIRDGDAIAVRKGRWWEVWK